MINYDYLPALLIDHYFFLLLSTFIYELRIFKKQLVLYKI